MKIKLKKEKRIDEVVKDDLINIVKVDDKIVRTMTLIISIKEKSCGFARSDQIECKGFKRLLILFANLDFEV